MNNECGSVTDDIKAAISPIIDNEKITADVIKAILQLFGGSAPYLEKTPKKNC